MRKSILLIALFITTTIIAQSQAREDRIELIDAQRLVLSIELSYPSKTVSDALDQKLKDERIKTKSSKGFIISEGAKFLDVTPDMMDYYFKVETKEKDKEKSILYFGISKGNTNFITGETDPKIWESGKTFLNRFVTYVYQYKLGLDISAQEKVIKDAEKALEKSVKEGEDLAKKAEENKKDQESKKADVEKQKALLNDLNNKKVK